MQPYKPRRHELDYDRVTQTCAVLAVILFFVAMLSGCARKPVALPPRTVPPSLACVQVVGGNVKDPLTKKIVKRRTMLTGRATCAELTAWLGRPLRFPHAGKLAPAIVAPQVDPNNPKRRFVVAAISPQAIRFEATDPSGNLLPHAHGTVHFLAVTQTAVSAKTP